MNNESGLKGTLFIVATPIGNLQDISARALTILGQVAWIAAEDTRHSVYLLRHYGIQTPLKSLHEHNEGQRAEWIAKTLNAGVDIALISDAGTPLISDPGFTLITHLIQQGFQVSPIPGCCAAIAALCVSGLPTDRFLFQGFLPAQSSKRRTQLTNTRYETATQIFYEAPHRFLDCLDDMVTVYGAARAAVVARELTKTYEQVQRGSVQSLLAYYQAHADQVRGEIVIMVAGAPVMQTELIEAQRILSILLTAVPVKQAASLAADITGLRKNELYQIALRINS